MSVSDISRNYHYLDFRSHEQSDNMNSTTRTAIDTPGTKGRTDHNPAGVTRNNYVITPSWSVGSGSEATNQQVESRISKNINQVKDRSLSVINSESEFTPYPTNKSQS